ncbi:MAG: cation-transporting P-type ATPase, partial [Opitutaceae bacterium]
MNTGSSDTTPYTGYELELLNQLGSSTNGLSSEQAAKKLDEVGPNTVAAGRRKSVVMDLLYRCRNPLVVQLLIIAAVCYATADTASDKISAYIVLGMVFLSVFLSYFQETRSSRAV